MTLRLIFFIIVVSLRFFLFIAKEYCLFYRVKLLLFFLNKNRKLTFADKRYDQPLFSENWFGYL